MRNEVTGDAVQRLAPGSKFAVHAEELQALQFLIESVATAQGMNRTDVRSCACEDFKTD